MYQKKINVNAYYSIDKQSFHSTVNSKNKVICSVRFFRTLSLLFSCLFLFNYFSIAQTTITKRVAASGDDAEQRVSGGAVLTTSTDLELTEDVGTGANQQIIGIRFTGLAIPVGSIITNATITFRAVESTSTTTNLLIHGQSSATTLGFTTSTNNISLRPNTSASVAWSSLPSWSAGATYNTPNLSAVIQEIIGLPGWASGNSIVLKITGTGNRRTYAYDWEDTGPTSAPLLSITYITCPPTGTPVFTLGSTSFRCADAGSETYTATATNATSYTYAISSSTGSGGTAPTINTSNGTVTYSAGWAGTATITVTAIGCSGNSTATATHTITVGSTPPMPTFSLGATSGRCIGAGTVTYTATASNSTISYTIANAGTGTEPTINTTSGQVTYPAGWSGTSTITATATACSNTATATHSVTTAAVIAVNDSATGVQGNPIPVNMAGNDLCSPDPASITIITPPVNGSVQFNNTSGQYFYLPNGSYTGTDAFTYQICAIGSPTICSQATVTVTINPGVFDPCNEANKPKTYYLPFPENNDQLKRSLESAGNFSDPHTANVRSLISIKVLYPGTIIRYDHWEDGYEANITAPVQASTLVWGDGNLVNGAAPGYPNDILPAGAIITLIQQFPYRATTTSNSPIVPDGKDKIYSSNDLAISKVVADAGIAGTNNYFNVQNLKTNVIDVSRFGNLFVIPFGENITTLTNPTAPLSISTPVFKYVGLFVRAAQNGTIVNLDLQGDGTVDVTSPVLAEGQVWFYNGTGSTPDGVSGDVNNANDIKSGAVVTANFPVGVDLVFGDLGSFGTRNIAILPGAYYGNTYYSPVYSTYLTGTLPAPVYALFTNSLLVPITITWERGGATPATGTLTIPAKGQVSYRMDQAAGYKFSSTSGQSFTAVAIIDADDPGSAYDWAYNMIPEERLSTFSSLAWAPGSSDLTANTNPVWVTPTANTTLYIKYDGDITATGGLVSPCGLPYDATINMVALNSYKIKDSDNDQTGIAIYTCDGTKIAAVWGQEPETTTTGGQPGMDVGYVMEPKCVSQLAFANDDVRTTELNTPVVIDVATNDVGFLVTLDPAAINTVGLMQPANGTIVVNGDGTITYTPNNGFVGTDQFEYRICDVLYATTCDVALVTVKIGVCDATPALENLISGKVYIEQTATNNGVYDGTEIAAAGAKVYLYNATGCPNPVVAGTIADSTTADLSGYYEFRPRNSFMAADDFDNADGSSSALAGNDGSLNWAADWVRSSTTNVILAQDAHPTASGNALRFASASNAYRQVTFSGTPPSPATNSAMLRFSYRREGFDDDNETMTVAISNNNSTYTTITSIDDGNGAGTDATYTNMAVPFTPYASGSTYIRFSQTNASGTEYFYIDNVSVSFTAASACYAIAVDPNITNYTRTAPLQQSAGFTGLGGCDKDNNLAVLAKLTTTDDVANTNPDAPVDIAVLGNDVIGQPDPATVTTTGMANQSANGTVAVNPDGTITYTPNVGFTGVDDFEYQVCSIQDPSLCDIALVTVTVNCSTTPANTQVISGIVYSDANNGGTYNTGELGLANVGVELYDDANGNGLLDAGESLIETTITNAGGGYKFSLPVEPNSLSVRDEFNTTDGTGNDGTDVWAGNWIDEGESTANSWQSGDVQIPIATGTPHNTNKLFIQQGSNGAKRTVNLSGATSATLTFDFITDAMDGEAGEVLNVQVASSASPSSWITLETITNPGNTTGLKSYAIPVGAISSTTTIRFFTGSSNGGDHWYFDNVQVAYSTPPVTNRYIVRLAQPIPEDYTLTQPTPSPGGVHTASITGTGSDCQNNFGLYKPIIISGKVYNDANGLLGDPINTVDGENYTGGGLFATLVGPDNLVISSTPISTVDGTYSFSGIAGNTSYRILLDTLVRAVNTFVATTTTGTVPGGWASTGENIGIEQGSDGSPNSTLTVVVGTGSKDDANFGIEERPTAGSGVVKLINPNRTIQAFVPPLAFAFNDTLFIGTPSTDVVPGTVSKIRITSFPTGAADISIDGITYTLTGSGTTVPWPSGGVYVDTDSEGYPTVDILVDPAVNDSTTVVISFVAVDNAGVESENTGTATIIFLKTPIFTGGNYSISGTVFHDIDGAANGISNLSNVTIGGLNAVLMGSDGAGGQIVYGVRSVNPADGSYFFGGLPDGNYTVLLTTSNPPEGAPEPSVQLPLGWSNTGEFWGAGSGSDEPSNGKLNVTINSADEDNANFGIQQPPTATSTTMPNQANNQGDYSIPIPATQFIGSDPDGVVEFVTITDFPSNVVSITIGGVKYGAGFTPWPVTGGVKVSANVFGQPSVAIAVDPVDGFTSVVIPFRVTDNANAVSPIASVTVPFTIILPVTFGNIRATINDCAVTVLFETLSEHNNKQFDIEHSTDGRSWKWVTTIQSKGNSSSKQLYSYTDDKSVKGWNYYRVKQTDLDRNALYSQTIAINAGCNANGIYSVYPNPVSDMLQILIPGTTASKVQIRLSDAQGRILSTKVSIDNTTATLSVGHLPAGVYTLQVLEEKAVSFVAKIIKQ